MDWIAADSGGLGDLTNMGLESGRCMDPPGMLGAALTEYIVQPLAGKLNRRHFTFGCKGNGETYTTAFFLEIFHVSDISNFYLGSHGAEPNERGLQTCACCGCKPISIGEGIPLWCVLHQNVLPPCGIVV